MATQNTLPALAGALAKKLDFAGKSEELVQALKSTAFRGNVTDAQMMALMAVASQYALNPWTKEIYAFPDKAGIVPVVGVDGWSKIINQHPDFDGVEFTQDEKSCTCAIYRKGRAHPTKITEFMVECQRPTQPWKTHPRRMLRHKAFIQCARLAFGYVGIYDADEAARIIEARAAENRAAPVQTPAPAPETAPEDIIDVQAHESAPATRDPETVPDIQYYLERIAGAQTLEALKIAATTAWQKMPAERAAIKFAHDARKAELQDEDIPL